MFVRNFSFISRQKHSFSFQSIQSIHTMHLLLTFAVYWFTNIRVKISSIFMCLGARTLAVHMPYGIEWKFHIIFSSKYVCRAINILIIICFAHVFVWMLHRVGL